MIVVDCSALGINKLDSPSSSDSLLMIMTRYTRETKHLSHNALIRWKTIVING